MKLELFPCSGGMAEGFRRAGITFDVAIDHDKDACDSYEKNLGHRPLQMDVNDLHRLVVSGWRPATPLDLLVADPPCTPWSRAGKREGLKDERDCLVVTADLIRLLRPRAYLIGNVPGLQDSTQWGVVQRVIGGLRDIGYCVRDYVSLDAADYGSIHLCQRHADFAGRLSDPTTAPGSVGPTHRSPGRSSPISRVEDAANDSARTTGPASVEAATPSRSATNGDRRQSGPPTETGKADVSSTIADMFASGSAESSDTDASIGSSPRQSSADRSTRRKSSTTRTNERATTPPTISSPIRLTATTCANTSSDVSARDAEVAGCPDCRWKATPQHRVRPFWFGHLDGPCIKWPARTHASPEEAGRLTLPGVRRLQPWVTCRQALGHLSIEELGRPVKMRIREKGEDGTKNGGDLTRCSAPDGPAKTVVSRAERKGGQILIPNGTPPSPVATTESPAPTIRSGATATACPRSSCRPQSSTHAIRSQILTNRPPTALDQVHRSITTQSATTAVLALEQPMRGARIGGPDRPSDVVTSDPARVGAAPGQVLEWPWNRPSTTIFGDERLSVPGHHDATVGNSSHKGPNAIVLSEKAAAILQGFPDGWLFSGETKRARWGMIGQAMPPPLAEAVAKSVAAQMVAARSKRWKAIKARSRRTSAAKRRAARQ